MDSQFKKFPHLINMFNKDTLRVHRLLCALSCPIHMINQTDLKEKEFVGDMYLRKLSELKEVLAGLNKGTLVKSAHELLRNDKPEPLSSSQIRERICKTVSPWNLMFILVVLLRYVKKRQIGTETSILMQGMALQQLLTKFKSRPKRKNEKPGSNAPPAKRQNVGPSERAPPAPPPKPATTDAASNTTANTDSLDQGSVSTASTDIETPDKAPNVAAVTHPVDEPSEATPEATAESVGGTEDAGSVHEAEGGAGAEAGAGVSAGAGAGAGVTDTNAGSPSVPPTLLLPHAHRSVVPIVQPAQPIQEIPDVSVYDLKMIEDHCATYYRKVPEWYTSVIPKPIDEEVLNARNTRRAWNDWHTQVFGKLFKVDQGGVLLKHIMERCLYRIRLTKPYMAEIMKTFYQNFPVMSRLCVSTGAKFDTHVDPACVIYIMASIPREWLKICSREAVQTASELCATSLSPRFQSYPQMKYINPNLLATSPTIPLQVDSKDMFMEILHNTLRDAIVSDYSQPQASDSLQFYGVWAVLDITSINFNGLWHASSPMHRIKDDYTYRLRSRGVNATHRSYLITYYGKPNLCLSFPYHQVLPAVALLNLREAKPHIVPLVRRARDFTGFSN